MSSATVGVYLAMLFWVNHVGMPGLQAGHSLTVLEQQVTCTRNVKHARVLDFLYGGLDFQIEHHLVPTGPSTRLRRLQAITRPRCVAAALPYHEEGPFQALVAVTRHVRRVAAEAESEQSV